MFVAADLNTPSGGSRKQLMTLTLEIAPELLAALDALAAEEGLDPSTTLSV